MAGILRVYTCQLAFHELYYSAIDNCLLLLGD